MPDLPNVITYRECALGLAILTGLIVLQATSNPLGSMLVMLLIIAIELFIGWILRPTGMSGGD